jgi:hypothetical protein
MVCVGLFIVPPVRGAALIVTVLVASVVPPFKAVMTALEQPTTLKRMVALVEPELWTVPQETVQLVAEHEPLSV